MSASNDLGQWYKSIPPITRTWFTASVIVPVAARLGIVQPQNLVLFVKPIINNFQVCFLFYLYLQIYKLFFI
jgi:derlin-1